MVLILRLPSEFDVFKKKVEEYKLDYKNDVIVLKYLNSISKYLNGDVNDYKSLLLRLSIEFNSISEELTRMDLDRKTKAEKIHFLYNISKNLNLMLNNIHLKCEWCKKKQFFIYFEDNMTCIDCYEKY